MENWKLNWKSALSQNLWIVKERFWTVINKSNEFRTSKTANFFAYLWLSYFLVYKFFLDIPFFQEIFLIMTFYKIFLFYWLIAIVAICIYILASLIIKLLLYVFN